MALGIGAACIGALELLQLPLEAVLAAILPLIGITGDIALDGAEAVIGPVIITTMLLPYLVPPPLVRQIRAEDERARGLLGKTVFRRRHIVALFFALASQKSCFLEAEVSWAATKQAPRPTKVANKKNAQGHLVGYKKVALFYA